MQIRLMNARAQARRVMNASGEGGKPAGLIIQVGSKPADERGRQRQKTLINTPPQTDGSGSERRGGVNAKM